jgi:hypothetical protein
VIGQRLVLAYILLLTAVPGGCLPAFAAGVAKQQAYPSDVRTVRGEPVPGQASRGSGWMLVAALLLLAVVANWRVWRIVRRVRGLGEDGAWMGLGRSAWLTVLSLTYVMGIAMGVLMMAQK